MQTGVREGMQSNRYDFDRLQRSVDFLIEEHERLSGERAALLEELFDRERRIATLESKLESERSRRLTAIDGVNRILGRLERLQADVSDVGGPA